MKHVQNTFFPWDHGVQTVHISNGNAFLRSWPTDTGCHMIEGVIVDVSLHNRQERQRIERFAREILKLLEATA